MRKKVLILSLIILMITAFSCSFVGASADVVVVSRAYDIMREFVSENPARESGSEGAKSSAEYVKNFFDGLGLETEMQSFTYETYTYAQSGMFSYPIVQKIEDQNVIAHYKASVETEETVIIGAHYDNTVQEGAKGQGAYGNGSGVGVMLSFAEKIRETSLPFNLTFIAFGAGESLMAGSEYYLSTQTASKKSSILLYINLDSIAGGDNLYVYADEVRTIQENYFVNLAARESVDLRPAPVNKGAYGTDYTNMGYAHPGLESDNLFFFREGILSVNFTSCNWTVFNQGVVDESADDRKGNVLGTENDTMEMLDRMYGDSAKIKMNAVEKLLYKGLTGEDFRDEMFRARRENPDYSTMTNKFFVPAIGAVILIIVSALAIVLHKKYKESFPLKPGDGTNGRDKGEDSHVFAEFD